MAYELKNRQLFNTQIEIFKIHRSLNSLKNSQDNIFLHRKNEYFYESEELMNFNSHIYRLDNLIDSISSLKIIKKNKFSGALKDLKSDIEKYQNQCFYISKVNEELFSPTIGVISQLDIISRNLRKEEKYQELDLIKYLDDMELYREQLNSNQITKREFEKKVAGLFKKIAATEIDDYEKYFILLFEDNISSYYNNIQLEYSKSKEIGESYDNGLLYYLEIQYTLLINKIIILENKIIKIRDDYFRKGFIQYLSIVLVVIVLNIILFNLFYRLLYKPWAKMQSIFENLSEGVISKANNFTKISEFKTVINYLNEVSENINQKNIFVQALTQKKYNQKFEVKKKDELGFSLSKLQEELIKSEKESKQYQETERNQKWAATGIADIGAVMRQHTEDINSLAKNVLNKIIEYVNAVQGALFLHNKETNKLELIASFSYDKQRIKKTNIEPFEGVLGTILVEKREYYYEKIPENYIFLDTGLGFSKPKSLFAFPLLFEDIVYGVIELASMTEFKEFERNFLMSLGVEIAITISYTGINVETKTLLEQSKKQAQELKSNEKLYKKNQDNLKSLLRTKEQKLTNQGELLKNQEKIIKQKRQELFDIQKEISDKDELHENMINEYENIKTELENKNKELRDRIAYLEKKLRKEK